MYGVFKARLIVGVRLASRPRPWVARLTGADVRWGFQRTFIQGTSDYTYAARSGRGTVLYFALAPGLYEYYKPISWKHDERGFLRVDEMGESHPITRQEVLDCLKNTILE